MALNPGTRLGPFEIAGLIGAGGMGEVYRASDTTLKRAVAIKVLPESLASDADRLARFLREAEVLASLSHPNIAAVYGLERTVGATALVMEFVEGQTLAERLADKNSGLPLDEVLAIARQITDALEAAHDRGIVHRDLKPANIKIRPDGTVKVLDFGLAKVIEPGSVIHGSGSDGAGAMLSQSPTITTPAMTQAGFILGTAAYMSPEQARGRPVDRRADIWAFGCVLYEMLTGRRAFDGDDVSITLARVLEREVDLETLPTGIPVRLRQVITLCLRKDHRQRVQSIGDVRLALDGAFEATIPQTAVSPAARQPLWRRAASFAALTTVFAVTLGFLALRPAPLPDVMRFQIHAPAGSTLPLGTPAPSPDGRTLAYTVSDADGVRRIHVRPIDRLETRALPGTEGAVHPFWSPDGRSIAYVTLLENQLKRLDLDAGAPRILSPVTGPWHGTWSPDGTILHVRGPVIFRISAEGGESIPAGALDKQRDETNVAYPFFLSDGRRFLVRAVTAGKPSIQLGTLGSMTRTLVLDAAESAPLLASSPSGRRYLLLLRGTDLIAQDFDERSGTVAGDPVVLVSDIGRVASPAIRPSVGVSPDVLAYQSGGASLRRQLAWVDRSGSDVDRLPVDASVDFPQLSPNELFVAGSRLDSATSSNVWVTDLRRGASTRITFSGYVAEVVWSPDGTRLAFRRPPISSSAPGIYVIGTDGANERQLMAVDGRVTSWSTDGKYILYNSAGKLMMFDTTGAGAPIEVGPSNSTSTLATFSPDARFIAYHSNESGRSEIYVRATPPATQRIKVSINGGVSPRWRRDGREMYFLNQDAVMAVDVETRDAFSAGVPRELFRTTDRVMTNEIYDVSADGKRFLLPARETGADDRPITVVLNWWVELESRR